MTPSCGGWRNSEVSHGKGDVKGNNIRKLKKSVELFAVLEFLRNLICNLMFCSKWYEIDIRDRMGGVTPQKSGVTFALR